MTSTEPKIWLITGASIGFGRSVVEHALAQGDIVVATLRKPAALSDLTAQYPPSRFITVKLDVTSAPDITAAFATAIAQFGRIDIVYNNAGYIILSEVEGTPDDVARAEFEVNFWGAANVAREAVRVFRDVNVPQGGRLLQASSKAGVHGYAGLGYYSASKFALEGVSESLAREVHPSWNIKVTILEIGGFHTRLLAPESMVDVPAHPAYAASGGDSMLLRKYFSAASDLGDPKKGAREIFKITRDDSVPLRIALGLDTIEIIKDKLKELENVTKASESWSADLR